MKKTIFICLSLITINTCCFAESDGSYIPVPPEESKNYKAYNPWYTGPIVVASAENLSPGILNINPYIYAQNNYGTTTNSWRHKAATNECLIQYYLSLQTGITKWLDITLLLQENTNYKKSYDAFKFDDTYVEFGIQLMRQVENTWKPSLRLRLDEGFPTGKYKNLNPKKLGIDGVGSGSYVTRFGFCASKIVFWSYYHPINFHMSLFYNIYTKAHVKGFNTYGGGYGTKGKVSPGNVFNGVVSFEYSFTQRWVYAMDFSYAYQGKTKFSGTNGIGLNGNTASNTAKSNVSISLAPAIEYNFSDNLGVMAGAWFSIAGKNTSDFVTSVIYLTYNW